MENKFITIFVTCGSVKEAGRIADSLLSKRLVACANIIPGIKSIFRWQGKVDKAAEILVMMKTRSSNFARIEKEVKRLHSYEVPEIIALPIVAGSKDYLKWIDSSVR